jgi:hypothetical protein
MTTTTNALTATELSKLRYAQQEAVAHARKALILPLDPPPSAPWAEVELRICNSYPGDPDALQYTHEGLDHGHLYRMVETLHARHVLLNRIPDSGVSCYAVYAPTNVSAMLGNDEVRPVLKEIARFSLSITPAHAAGYAVTVDLTSPTGDDVVHAFSSPDIPGCCRGALHWIYQGYPMLPRRIRTHSSLESSREAVPTPVGIPEEYTGVPQRSRMRTTLGWFIRWPLAYAVTGVYLLATLGAAAYSWTTGGVYAEEIITAVKGCLYAAVLGTATKYLGVWVASGTSGVIQELSNGRY